MNEDQKRERVEKLLERAVETNDEFNIKKHTEILAALPAKREKKVK